MVGLAYVAGEQETDAAFAGVKQAAAVAAASHDFKAAVASMRTSASEFTSRPTQDLVEAFRSEHFRAASSLDTIETSLKPDERKKLGSLREDLATIKENFNRLLVGQQSLGYTEMEGQRGRLATRLRARAGAAKGFDVAGREGAPLARVADGHAPKRSEYRLQRMSMFQMSFFADSRLP